MLRHHSVIGNCRALALAVFQRNKINAFFENLRRLRTPYFAPVERTRDFSVLIGFFHCVGRLCCRYCRAFIKCRFYHGGYLFGSYEATRTVVNSHEIGVLRYGGKSVFSRTGACISTENHARKLCYSVFIFEFFVIIRKLSFICYNDNLIYKLAVLKGAERMRNDAFSAKLYHLF